MTKRVRPTVSFEEVLEDAIVPHTLVFDDNNGTSLLKRMDARDAMRLAQTSNTGRFGIISTLLREEYIWQYWTKRDMDGNYATAFDALPAWLHENAGTPRVEPKWKVVYMWLRLLASLLQNYYLTNALEELGDKFPYSPGDQLEFVQFNQVKLTTAEAKGIILLDFRDVFLRIYPLITGKKVNLKKKPILDRIKFPDNNLKYSLGQRYSRMNNNALDGHVQNLKFLLTAYFGRLTKNDVHTIFHVPRLVEETTIMVGAPICIECSATQTQYMCECHKVAYCSKQCFQVHE